MTDFLKQSEPKMYALLRIVTGFLFLWHGSQKLFGFPGEIPPGAPTFILYVAGPIELLGGTFVLVGLFTRWAAFLCSGLMAFAYWIGHGTKALLPITNGGELPTLYCFAFLLISTRGAGIWSIDAAREENP